MKCVALVFALFSGVLFAQSNVVNRGKLEKHPDGLKVLAFGDNRQLQESGVHLDDIVIEIDSKKVRTPEDFAKADGSLQKGEHPVDVVVLRAGKKLVLHYSPKTNE